MNIFRRVKNLWLLSNFTVTKNSNGGVDVFVNTDNKQLEVKPRMAQIIKRSDPVGDFLKESESEK